MPISTKLRKWRRWALRRLRGAPKLDRRGRKLKTIEFPSDVEAVLASMYDSKPQQGIDGALHGIDTNTRIFRRQGELLHRLYREIKPKLSIEIGLAYGFSTVYILSALREQGVGHHIAIDPFQTAHWHGIGAAKAARLGMANHFSLIEDFAEFALPGLIREGRQAEFIFIDGDHRFDSVIMDFTLCDRLLRQDGVIVLDDLWMPAIRRVVSFIEANRADYERLVSVEPNAAVFRKIQASDERSWDHYVAF